MMPLQNGKMTIQTLTLLNQYMHISTIDSIFHNNNATYQIEVTTDEGRLSFLKDMPTKPKTHKGIKSQNDKLSRWVEKQVS